jgi:UDPglucose--hexose-1-phosphate uridylyltransferase
VNQLRLNPLTGRWVTVATGRASRPEDFATDQTPVESGPPRPCPFCPGHEEELPPALETYGPTGEWLLRVVPNRFPAFQGTGSMQVEHLGPLFAKAPATGIHEVLVLSREHLAGWADLDDPQAGLVMAALRDRLEDHAHSSGVRYSQAIVNHGRAAGASLRHPHGQLMGIPFVPGEIVEEIAGFRRFSGGCLLCATVEAERAAGHRTVADEPGVMVVAPWWSGVPFELLVIPTHHEGHLREAAPADLAAVGRAVRDALASLRGLMGDVPYNIVVHTLPHHASDPFHWHLHVIPRVHSVGGFEQGTGVPINIVAPEGASRLLVG